jgi:ABC-type polysaccharide/polyol phosphate transport system ATPase subunit
MDGARLGIIGHNGSGKTTLLRLISGVYTPQAGDVHIVGRLSSYTDIALGMDPEANGYDNIIFRCVFLGLTFREARAAIPAIAEFSDLGNFLNMPVRTYSTGMFVRLAFSISTHLYSDILVMDEMIGAGDAAFIEKARKRTEEVVQKAKILVIASHDANLLQALCNKVLWLERGEQRMLGNPAEVLDAYRKSVSNAA